MEKILIVVDMQNDFIDGSLGTDYAVSIVNNVIKEIKKSEYDYIYVTQDTHKENYLETLEGKKLPVKHCIKATSGWLLNKDILKALESVNYHLIEKDTFGSITLANLIKEKQVKEIYLCGLCTDICILSNAILLRAYLPNTIIKVISNACAGTSKTNHDVALQAMKCCQIDII